MGEPGGVADAARVRDLMISNLKLPSSACFNRWNATQAARRWGPVLILAGLSQLRTLTPIPVAT